MEKLHAQAVLILKTVSVQTEVTSGTDGDRASSSLVLRAILSKNSYHLCS